MMFQLHFLSLIVVSIRPILISLIITVLLQVYASLWLPFLFRRFDSHLATLAGIAVSSDVMPLVGNNLELAKMMLPFINKHHYRNLSYILGNGTITYDDINFMLIPSFNSVGRIMKDSASTNKLTCAFRKK